SGRGLPARLQGNPARGNPRGRLNRNRGPFLPGTGPEPRENIMNMKQLIIAVSLVAALVGTTGCATKKYGKEETGAVNTRVDEVQGQVEESQTRLNKHDQTLAAHEQQMGQISQTAQDALRRAQEAGKLAEGKFLYETVLTDEKVKFGFDTSDLSPEAKSA